MNGMLRVMNPFNHGIRFLPTAALMTLAACSNPKASPQAAPAEAAATPPPLIKALSPAASIATMQMPGGYRLEPVLTEPDIAEPVMVAFDGNGRMYVAEMRTYMQNADAKGEQQPFSRVSRHEDTDGDGVYDKHTVFADKLLLPRIMLPLDDRIITGRSLSRSPLKLSKRTLDLTPSAIRTRMPPLKVSPSKLGVAPAGVRSAVISP